MNRRPQIAGALAELQRRQEAELRHRQGANNILEPGVIGSRNGISSAKLLQTSMGGVLRPITAQDLKVFRARARELGSKVRQGLTAQEVIDMSTPVDRERAREQIRSAIPTRLHSGEVLFTTNAGPDSRVNRHLVVVQFPAYSSAVSYPGSPAQAAKLLAEMPLRLDCTCERHTYFYRYVMTTLGAAAGRQETGYPKIRNEGLVGAGCKHIVRVMQELSSPGVRLKLAEMIRADRERLERPRASPRVITVSATEADRLASAKPKVIRTTSERERLQAVNAIRKALPKATGSVAANIEATMKALQARPDVTAQALLAALNTVLAKPEARA